MWECKFVTENSNYSKVLFNFFAAEIEFTKIIIKPWHLVLIIYSSIYILFSEVQDALKNLRFYGIVYSVVKSII